MEFIKAWIKPKKRQSDISWKRRKHVIEVGEGKSFLEEASLILTGGDDQFPK